MNALNPGGIFTNLQRHVSGRYFEDCHEAAVITTRTETTLAGVAPCALAAGNAYRLWEASLELVQPCRARHSSAIRA